MKYTDLVSDVIEFGKFKDIVEVEAKVREIEELEKSFQKNPTDEYLAEHYSNTPFYVFGVSIGRYSFSTVKNYIITMISLFTHSYKILDFGCGYGNSSIILGENGLNVTATDFEGINLDFVRFRSKKYRVNVKAVPLDKLDWDEKYDAIVCFDVLEHLKKPSETLNKLLNMLVPRGFLFITNEFSGPDIEAPHIASKDEAKKVMSLLGERMEKINAIQLPNKRLHPIPNYPLTYILKGDKNNE